MSDALLKVPQFITDIKGSGCDPGVLRSVSCNDISSKTKYHEQPKENGHNGVDHNNHAINHTQSITNVATASSMKPGLIIARSTEIIPGINGEIGNGDYNGDSQKPWSSLCQIPSSSIPSLSNSFHPFSGLLTSQLQCTECKWKVRKSLTRSFPGTLKILIFLITSRLEIFKNSVKKFLKSLNETVSSFCSYFQGPVRYDKLESVSLPLPPVGPDFMWRKHTLVDLLSRLVSSEVINDVQCDDCSNRCPAFITFTFGKSPKCLCVHIPRTTWSSSSMPIKMDDPVTFSDSFTFAESIKRTLR